MRGKRVIAAAVFLILVLGLCVFYVAMRGYTIELTEVELQEKLATGFPIEKTYLGIVKLTLSNPVLKLQTGSDRIALSVDCTVKALNSSALKGSGRLSGRLRFDSILAALYLDDPKVESLTIEGLPAEYRDAVNVAAGVAAREYFEKHPLYKLREADIRRTPFGIKARKVEVSDGVLRITLGPGG